MQEPASSIKVQVMSEPAGLPYEEFNVPFCRASGLDAPACPRRYDTPMMLKMPGNTRGGIALPLRGPLVPNIAAMIT